MGLPDILKVHFFLIPMMYVLCLVGFCPGILDIWLTNTACCRGVWNMQNSSSGGTCLSDTRCAVFFALVLIAFAPYHGNHRHRIDKYLYTIGTIQMAQCWFPGLAISNAKNKIHRSSFIKPLWNCYGLKLQKCWLQFWKINISCHLL